MRLALIAERQGGAFSFEQARRQGFSKATISRRLRCGAWRRHHPGVYSFAGAPPTRLLDLWAAVLAAGPGAVITHETAALAHGAERLATSPITLTNPHGHHHRLAGVCVHQIDDLEPHHRTTWHGLPISTPPRTVVELGATQHEDVVGRVLDDLLNAHKTTMSAVAAAFANIARPGKPGIHTVAKVLDDRGDGYVPPASELERSMFATLDAGGLPAPVRQLPLPGRGPIKGIADAGYLDARMLLEADGRRWHSRVEAARRDRERDAQVIRAGWVPLRFVYEQLRHAPGEVCAIVDETRAMRLAQLGRAA